MSTSRSRLFGGAERHADRKLHTQQRAGGRLPQRIGHRDAERAGAGNGATATISDTLAAALPPATVRFAAGEVTRRFTIRTQAVSAMWPAR